MPNPKVKSFLLNTLPDIAKEITDDVVDGVEQEMQREWHPEFEQAFGVAKPAEDITARHSVGSVVKGPTPSFYLVRATHSRLTGPGAHEFTGEVPMARVQLPKEHRRTIADTALGTVIDGDHRLYSVDLLNDYYDGRLGFEADRVDLITPVRYGGHRFAAIAIYLIYGGGKLRSFAMEAGMATGKPMVLYASRDLKPIVRRAGYKPTPFSDIDHWYHGALHLNGEEPTGWTIEIFKDRPVGVPRRQPFFRLTATLTPQEHAMPVSPFGLILQAAMRVTAIADARGEQVPDLGPLTSLVAPLGRNLSWNKLPES